MYPNNRKTQPDVCLICGEPVLKTPSPFHLFSASCVCPACLDKFRRLDRHTTISGYPLTILYAYDEFFKSLLYQYKGLYDFALKDAFLPLDLPRLKDTYKHHIVVPAPSASDANTERGFEHCRDIARTFSNHVFTGLCKTRPYKQALLTYEERSHVKDVIAIKNGEFLRHQKLLMFDDVITSGSTMRACISLCETYAPESIDVLVLSTKSFDHDEASEDVKKRPFGRY